MFASGPDDALDACSAVFGAVGRTTLRLGDEPGAGTRLKLVVNHWVLGLVERSRRRSSSREAIDVDPRALRSRSIEGGPLGLAYAQLKGKAMIEGEFAAELPARARRQGRAADPRGGRAPRPRLGLTR